MEKKVEIRLKKSRKAFLVEYVCGIFLLALLGLMYYKNVNFTARVAYFVVGLSLFSLGSAELSRVMHRYVITETKLAIIHGLIKQNRKHVDLYSLGFVPEINVKQTRMQRLFNYGTVYIAGTGQGAFEIKDIDSPQKIMCSIERFIQKNRESLHSS